MINFVGNQDTFKTKSNRMSNEGLVGRKQLYCKNHITGFWLEGFKQCAQGRRKGEECEKI